jgi:very-short-patch-repair endonuclease
MAVDVVQVDRVIARLAGRQDGVVSRAQLQAAGVSRAVIDHRLGSGRLIAVYRGVYAVGHAALSDRGRIRAALLVAGPMAVASHSTGAYLHRLISTLLAVIEVTTAGSARRSRDGLAVHRTVRPEHQIVHGLRVTPVLRTLADLDYPAELTREALARRLVRPEDLPDGGPVATRSALEERMRRLVAAAGLPSPKVNWPLGPYVIDFAWPGHRVLVETDGWATHGHRAAFEADRARDADLTARGWIVLRFTWRQITNEPLLVAARIARAIGAAAAAAAA